MEKSPTVVTCNKNNQGALWALLASGLFAVVITMAKIAALEYHVLQILFFRQLVVFCSCLPTLARSFPANLKTQQPVLHVARLLGAFTALSFSLWAVTLLPLTTAVTLGFAQVFFAALLALIFLQEKVGVHRLGAVTIGFVGVVIVMRPSVSGLFELSTLVPVIGALGAGVAVISVRKLSQTESTTTLLVYQAVFIGLLAGVPLFWLWKTPDIVGLLLLLSMGFIATAAQWIGVKALRLGEASVIGNFQYTQLIYAALFGYLLFDEIPDAYTLGGAAVIICSSLYIVYRESLKAKRTLT
ncbi:MAG: DMT family transporter [Granulosicoccaceae bacterium]